MFLNWECPAIALPALRLPDCPRYKTQPRKKSLGERIGIRASGQGALEAAAKQAGETAKETGGKATETAKEAGKATQKQAEKATEPVKQAGQEGQKAIDQETESAKKGIEQTTKGKHPGSPADMQHQLSALFAKDSHLRGSQINSDRAEAELGWRASTPLSEGVRRYAEWMASRGTDVEPVPARTRRGEAGIRRLLALCAAGARNPSVAGLTALIAVVSATLCVVLGSQEESQAVDFAVIGLVILLPLWPLTIGVWSRDYRWLQCTLIALLGAQPRESSAGR